MHGMRPGLSAQQPRAQHASVGSDLAVEGNPRSDEAYLALLMLPSPASTA